MRFFLTTLLVLVVAFFLINSYGSTQTILTYTGVRAVVWGFIFLLVMVFFRLFWQVTLPRFVIITCGVFGILFLIVGLSLGIWWYLTPPNYVFSLIKLQPFPLVILGNGLIAVFITSLSLSTLKKYGKYIVYGLPLWFLFISWWVSLLPFDKYVAFTSEDGLVESAQFILVLITSLLLFLETIFSVKKKLTKRAVILFLLAIGFFGVAMEEISWGQRILDFATPTELSTVNVQNETTIHNIGILNQLQLVGYIAICIVGVIGGSWHKIHPNHWNKWIPTVLPWYLTIPALYYIVFAFNPELHPLSEPMEMLFYGGIFIWVFWNLTFVRFSIKQRLST